MFIRLFFLFITIPALELYLLLKIGSRIGFWPTIGVICLTAVLGASLARSQGLSVIQKLQTELSLGKLPGETMVEGLLILMAGIVLLTPGFLTDALGFAILFPPVRKWLIGKALKYIMAQKIGENFSGFQKGMFRNKMGEGRVSPDGEIDSTWHVDGEQN
ncbi:MAG: FxsA family protein [Fibrobacteria bacterium]|nr:FxsA family protein [Fibrobacteria bacterium]